MYLSRLILNPHSRAVQRDLSDCGATHRTVLRGFPDIPSDEEGARARMGVLYRLDYDARRNEHVLLVQSQVSPDWAHIPDNYLLQVQDGDRDNPHFKRIDHVLEQLVPGQNLRFRLLANPTRKLHLRNDPDRKSRHARRVDLFRELEQIDWLHRQAARSGFNVLDVRASPGPFGSKSYGRRPGGSRMSFNTVAFDGRLRISDIDRFRQALEQGLGPAKAYGFGLLSIAPVR